MMTTLAISSRCGARLNSHPISVFNSNHHHLSSYIQPLWGTAFAAMVLGEHVGLHTFVGAALILSACVWSSVGPTMSLAGGYNTLSDDSLTLVRPLSHMIIFIFLLTPSPLSLIIVPHHRPFHRHGLICDGVPIPGSGRAQRADRRKLAGTHVSLKHGAGRQG